MDAFTASAMNSLDRTIDLRRAALRRMTTARDIRGTGAMHVRENAPERLLWMDAYLQDKFKDGYSITALAANKAGGWIELTMPARYGYMKTVKTVHFTIADRAE